MKRSIFLLLSSIATGLLVYGDFTRLLKPEGLPPAATAAPAANALLRLSLPDLAGTMQSMAQWKGKVLVVNYWATWCPPCREEMPGFSRLHERYAVKGVQFVGISIDSVDKVRDFQKLTPVSYPLLIGGIEAAATSVDIGNPSQGLPFTAIFDRSGALSSIKLGRFKEADLEQRVQALIGDK